MDRTHDFLRSYIIGTNMEQRQPDALHAQSRLSGGQKLTIDSILSDP